MDLAGRHHRAGARAGAGLRDRIRARSGSERSSLCLGRGGTGHHPPLRAGGFGGRGPGGVGDRRPGGPDPLRRAGGGLAGGAGGGGGPGSVGLLPGPAPPSRTGPDRDPAGGWWAATGPGGGRHQRRYRRAVAGPGPGGLLPLRAAGSAVRAPCRRWSSSFPRPTILRCPTWTPGWCGWPASRARPS